MSYRENRTGIFGNRKRILGKISYDLFTIKQSVRIIEMNHNNVPVFDYLEEKDCSGCSACAAACPAKAIEMKPNREGFLYPAFCTEQCIDCNRCISICPQINIKSKSHEKHSCIYAGSAREHAVVMAGSSGGIFELLTRYFFEFYRSPCWVYGAVWDSDFKGVSHDCINCAENLDRLRVSKYVQSKKKNVFREINEKVNSNHSVMFVGAPCEVAGLKSYLGREFENLVTVDFVCKGSTSPLFMQKYIEEEEKKFKSHVTYINMRYKWEQMDNWIPQFIKVKFRNGKQILKEFYNTPIGHAFRLVQRSSCYDCRYTGLNKLSDITLGDYHGLKRSDAFFNSYGTSVVVGNTAKGKTIIDELRRKGYADLQEISLSQIAEANPAFFTTSTINSKRELLLNHIQRYSLKQSVKKVISKKDCLKMIIPWQIQRWILKQKRGY